MIAQLIVPDAVGGMIFVSRPRVQTMGRIYGGQVFAQAVMAAAQTVGSDRQLHSAHAYFLRGGDDAQPVHFEVLDDFNGGSFSNRRVVALQDGGAILTLTASFHRDTRANPPIHSPRDVPRPEDAVRLSDYLARYADRYMPDRTHIVNRLQAFDVRVVNGPLTFGENSGGDHVRFWFRLTQDIGGDQRTHRGLLAYFSDFALLASSLQHDRTLWAADHVQMATIDHALWIHAPVNVSEWLLYDSRSPWRDDGRGYSRGQIFDQDGRLIASTAQEGVVRITE